MSPARFTHTIWSYYKKNRRDFPWRNTRDPYKILVSEVMLQQTQASRVVEKYTSFLKKFPTIRTLAHASTKDVLREWKGLGYNRRALGLKKSAEIINTTYKGNVPADLHTLISLPSIGPATAGDILAFAWNIPVVVIETNIRSVFIHFFFQHIQKTEKRLDKKIHDKEILPLIEKTLDRKNPREWYYALMDYGAMLKRTHGNAGRHSAHYIKQSPFKGSNRELRSRIIQSILKKKTTARALAHRLRIPKKDIEKNLKNLEREGFITKHEEIYSIKS